ncbi:MULTISPECIES: DUF6531 domain-containing protein [unclassified Ruegeria]|uniref:DUF6531 domain-containing protein n=1 Tax=unclassified Ruegeria TaxID=2625375 RepID=UPI0014881BCF|nr:hypothetical protein [Ruegeria sp. HKCCD6109]
MFRNRVLCFARDAGASIFFHCMISISFAAYVLIAIAGPGHAGVNLKNGNFYITYTDIIVMVGGDEFSLSRTYNSKSAQNLSFGYGWGSALDTRLIIGGDGSVSVQEIGSGKIYSYVPASQTREQLDGLLDDIISGMEAGGWLSSDLKAEETRRELLTNAERRRSVYLALEREGLVQPVDIAVGTRFVATSGEQAGVEIFREPGGFYRRSRDGFERFNERGQLMETALRDEAYFRLNRDAQGHLREIVLEDDRRIRVESDEDGKIVNLRFGELEARYVYSDGNHLVRSTDVAGNTFQFGYDARVNMTSITYEDGTSLLMSYHPETQYIARQKTRQGRVTTYDYGDYPVAEEGLVDHYYTLIRTFESEASEEPYDERRTEYRIGVDSFGQRYTAGILEQVNGVETETRYHPCGSPTLQRRGSVQNAYEYDAKCRLTLKRQIADSFLDMSSGGTHSAFGLDARDRVSKKFPLNFVVSWWRNNDREDQLNNYVGQRF